MIVLIENRLPNWLASFFFHLLTRVPPILASVGNINGTKGTEVLNFFFSFTVCDNKYVYISCSLLCLCQNVCNPYTNDQEH